MFYHPSVRTFDIASFVPAWFVLPIVFALGFVGSICLSSCASTRTAITADSAEYHIIVKAPRAVIGGINPEEFDFVLTSKGWNENDRSYREHAYSYCVRSNEELVCMVSTHTMHVKFELEAIYRQPDPRSIPAGERTRLAERWERDGEFRKSEFKRIVPDQLCGKVRVGMTSGRFGFSGGRPVAAHWFDLEPTTDGWCQYTIPAEAFVATREAVQRNPNSNDIRTE